MKIYYHCNSFVSHARAGRDNRNALRAVGHEIVDDPRQADVVVLHDEPVNYASLLSRIKGMDVPVVGYCVVETDPMPQAYASGLRLVDEVWTCSSFSRDLLSKGGGNAHVIPHVVRRPRFTEDDLARVRALVGPPGPLTFYTVCDSFNPRKNLPALLRAFVTFGGSPRYRLVVKQYRKAADLSGLPGVVSISERLTDAEMAALHAACDCYVSAHCAEGWGLSLSEAMAFGKTVVATGYSGNLEFMNAENAFLVNFSKGVIRAEDLPRCPPFFTPDMQWAYVDEADLASKMRLARETGPRLSGNAAKVARRYGPEVVGRCMDRRIRCMMPGGKTVEVA